MEKINKQVPTRWCLGQAFLCYLYNDLPTECKTLANVSPLAMIQNHKKKLNLHDDKLTLQKALNKKNSSSRWHLSLNISKCVVLNKKKSNLN